jgi:hypothetical protein
MRHNYFEVEGKKVIGEFSQKTPADLHKTASNPTPINLSPYLLCQPLLSTNPQLINAHLPSLDNLLFTSTLPHTRNNNNNNDQLTASNDGTASAGRTLCI